MSLPPQIVEYLAAHASRPYLQLFRYLNKTLQQCSCEKGAEADCESNDSLSRRNSELSDYSVWTQDGEADVTVPDVEPPKHLTTEYTFGKDSQEWYTAMVLSFICMSCKSNSWDETHPLLNCVPLPMMAHAALVQAGSCDFTLRELLDALLTHTKFPSGSSVFCRLFHFHS